MDHYFCTHGYPPFQCAECENKKKNHMLYMRDEEISSLRAKLSEAHAKLSALRDLVLSAAPLAWVNRSDEQYEEYSDLARQWEVKAREILGDE